MFIYYVCIIKNKCNIDHLLMFLLFCYSSCFGLSCVMMAVSAYDPHSEFKHNQCQSVTELTNSQSQTKQYVQGIPYWESCCSQSSAEV